MPQQKMKNQNFEKINMAIFNLPQFEHESFLQYLFRLNDYHAQCVHFTYEKRQIYSVVLEGVVNETRATFESMCYGCMCYLNVDDIWGLFKSLSWYQWKYERADESFVCCCPFPYGFHAYSPCVVQFRDSFH